VLSRSALGLDCTLKENEKGICSECGLRKPQKKESLIPKEYYLAYGLFLEEKKVTKEKVSFLASEISSCGISNSI